MNRGVWVVTPEGLVPKHLYHRPITARSDLPTPMLIRDSMEPTLNPANGKRYDSKRAYEAAVRAAGCEIVGNEKVTAATRPEIDDPVHDIKAAIEQHSAPRRKRRTKNA